jgi:hypothetical protein
MMSIQNAAGIAGLVCLSVVAIAQTAGQAADTSREQPLIAIWQQDEGLASSEAPYLRVAIWGDGTVLFAKEASKWNHELQRGKIPESRIAQLKKALADSGVFDLKGTCYLVPDAPVDCIMVDLGSRKQMLYWDEVESPNYGININAKPQHVEFKKCWKLMNHLALVACPDQFELEKSKFEGPPRSWYLKEAIQSE